MSRALLYSLLFLFLAAMETGFVSSLPFPWSIIPLVPIVGVWLYHQIPSRIGAWYLLAWGVWYDYFALSLWSSKTVIAFVMIAVLVYASGRIFSRHSLYGLLGLSLTVSIGWMLVEALFRFFSPSPLSLAFNGFLLYESVLFAEFFLGIGLLFLSFLRVRERFSFKRKDSSL
ncbi:TPA: hypothetical protein DDZ10_01205 [Candidatus Uhrbacteria bacterium]|nr:MAG: hypothetical protein A3D69_02680 [Candidatus Uhrbacteria bacterium RIFCSPHIGHO2_02_FULL_54_11]HBL39268.1 hypothetical protein [Candidatus Uhrbacteria bacterium]